MMQITSAAWEQPEIISVEEPMDPGFPVIHLPGNDNPDSGCKVWITDSVFEYKGDLHLDAVLGDMSVFIDDHFLVLDPGAFDMSKRFLGACNPDLEGFIETLGGRGFDFCDPCD
jgi:hypothetical protein